MFVEGTTFWVRSDPHLWAIISDPQKNPVHVVHVNFTSMKDNARPHDPYNDPACVVMAGEHPFIDKPTCVYYGGVQIGSVEHLQHRYDDGDMKLGKPVSAELLAKMRYGATISEHILPIAYDILVEQGLV